MTDETPFSVPVGDGALAGHRGGEGPPALVLHGGPAVTDYTSGLAAELAPCLTTFRYTQRGVPPSEVGPPYSIESHTADAIAVLDAFGLERAWAVGHSWGGHLALHLAVSHPERLLGVVGVGALGAYGDVFAALKESLEGPLSRAQRARIAEIEAARRANRATEDDLRERWELIWPQFFVRPGEVTALPMRVGPECSAGTNASIEEHFGRRTLLDGLPHVSLPVLFVHGAGDPLALSSVERTAALVPDARLDVVADCGHFPWIEQPGEVGRNVEDFLVLAREAA